MNPENAHGGFGGQVEGQLAIGIGRENISGVMPLYLFKEHWQLAKLKAPPALGLMCALDVMAYQSDQLYIIPFLVLMKAIEKVKKEPSEVNKNMLKHIKQTCMEIVKSK